MQLPLTQKLVLAITEKAIQIISYNFALLLTGCQLGNTSCWRPWCNSMLGTAGTRARRTQVILLQSCDFSGLVQRPTVWGQPKLWWKHWEPGACTLPTPLTCLLVYRCPLCVSFQPAFCLLLLSFHHDTNPQYPLCLSFPVNPGPFSQNPAHLYKTLAWVNLAFSLPRFPGRDSELALFNWNAKRSSCLK